MDSIRVEKDFVSEVTEKEWKKGSVPRKPLKHRKIERHEDWRYIPIFDKDTWNMLVDLWNAQNEMRERSPLGSDPQDFLIFNDITASIFYIDLQKAISRLNLRWRSPHKCRHTYLSWFYAKTDEDSYLSLKVAGHKDAGSRQVYSHINQQIGLEQNFATQTKKKMHRVD